MVNTIKHSMQICMTGKWYWIFTTHASLVLCFFISLASIKMTPRVVVWWGAFLTFCSCSWTGSSECSISKITLSSHSTHNKHMCEYVAVVTVVYPCLSQEARCSRFVQRPGGQAATDGTDGCTHVCCVWEDRCSDLQTHGDEQETEALKTATWTQQTISALILSRF